MREMSIKLRRSPLIPSPSPPEYRGRREPESDLRPARRPRLRGEGGQDRACGLRLELQAPLAPVLRGEGLGVRGKERIAMLSQIVTPGSKNTGRFEPSTTIGRWNRSPSKSLSVATTCCGIDARNEYQTSAQPPHPQPFSPGVPGKKGARIGLAASPSPDVYGEKGAKIGLAVSGLNSKLPSPRSTEGEGGQGRADLTEGFSGQL